MPKDSIDEAVHLMDKDEIANFEDDLENFKVKFVYKKKNGMTRTALGTRNQRWIPEDKWDFLEEVLADPRSVYLLPYYDLERKDFRCFHISRFDRILKKTK